MYRTISNKLPLALKTQREIDSVIISLYSLSNSRFQCN